MQFVGSRHPSSARAARPTTRLRSALAGIGQQVAWLLLVVGVVSWRRGVLYEGGVDPVVLAKAGVAVAAAALAVAVARHTGRRQRIGLLPAAVVGTIAVVSLIGATAAGHLPTDLVLAARLALLAGTLLVLLATSGADRSVRMLIIAFAAVGLVAAASGAAVALSSEGGGRLAGALPPLRPNELAALLLPVAVALLAVVLRRGPRLLLPLAGLLGLGALILWTGSRTALGLLVLAAVVLFVQSGRLTRRTVTIAAGVAVIGAATLAVGGVLTTLLLRGEGIGRLLTLNSRTIAWREVFATPVDSWAWWVGRGLSEKRTAVRGQFWDEQVFDSSWVSAFAQTGVIGTALLLALVLVTVVALYRMRPIRPLWITLAIVLALRGVVENGLIESSATFVLFFTLATLSWPALRRRRTAHLATPEPRSVETRPAAANARHLQRR